MLIPTEAKVYLLQKASVEIVYVKKVVVFFIPIINNSKKKH